MNNFLELVHLADRDVGLCGAKMAGAMMVWKDDPLIPADVRAHMAELSREDTELRAKREAAVAIAYAQIVATK